MALGAVPHLALAQSLTADGFLEIRIRSTALGILEDGAGRTEAWVFGSGPEPTVIRAQQGVELKLRFINDLPQEVWLHLFGVRGPSEMMTFNVPPDAAEATDCVFTPPDAGTFWIGPIADQSRTRDMGLYAVLVVEESAPEPGLAEQALVLDDWKIDEEGAIEGDFGNVEAMVGEGRLGNWFTINNRYRPHIPLARNRITRLRVLNAANVRVMNLLFRGDDPLLMARDGQPVKPELLDGKALVLAPGQRADLLVSVEQGEIRLALDLFEDVVEIGYLTPGGESGEIAPVAENFALPPNPLPALGALNEAATIGIVLEGGIKGGLKSAILNGAERDLRTLLENGKGWAMNGVAGPAPEPLFTAKQGETVLLEIDNRTGFAQPLHLHGHVWQVIDEEASGLWQDTAVIPARSQVTLAFVANNPGTWALHSLIAERSDGGLMRSFLVSEPEPEN